MNITKINKYNKSKTEQHFCNQEKTKQLHLQIKIHLKNITKIQKYKKIEVQCTK